MSPSLANDPDVELLQANLRLTVTERLAQASQAAAGLQQLRVAVRAARPPAPGGTPPQANGETPPPPPEP